MRVLFAVIAALGVATAPLAAAQDTQTPQHVAAARDALQALFVDTGVAADASARAFTLLAPQLRQSISGSPFFQTLTPARQQGLIAYFETIGAVGSEETVRGAPALLDRFAPRFAALFNEAELRDIATFMRSTDGGAAFHQSVMDGVDGAAIGAPPTPLTPAQQAAITQFSLTPGGAAFDAREAEMSAVLREMGEQATGAPHISERFQRDMCAILEEQCPAALRN